jgi:hypothetical protein
MPKLSGGHIPFLLHADLQNSLKGGYKNGKKQ